MAEKEKQQTIYDISSRAGVSIATVSRVLNGSPKVSSKTKERVLQIIEECGYEPNAFARGLGTGSMRTIGILCADVADLYLANAVSFLERELRLNGFDTVLNCTGYDYETKVQCMRMMESRRVDAVILVGSQYIESTAKRNRYIIEASRNIPVMLLNGYLKGDNIYGNLSDDHQAFYEAASRLYKSGCRRILFLYREKTYSCRLKQQGYSDALRDCGLLPEQELCLQSNGKIEQIKKSLTAYYREKHSFDSVLACDDELAIAALKFAGEQKLSIPEEISLIGCNNSVLSICCSPELSSIDNKCEMLCINTVTSLMRVLEGQSVSHKTMLLSEYIERNTTRHINLYPSGS